MSLSDYISGKRRDGTVSVSTSYIRESLRDILLAARSGAEVHRTTANIPALAEALMLVGYPRNGRLLFHVENPSDREFSEEYTRLLRWCQEPRVTEASSAVSRLASDVGFMRSSYFLGESIDIHTVDESVDILSRFASENCERVRDILEDAMPEMDIETRSLLVCAHSDSVCKIATRDGSLVVERRGGHYSAKEVSGSEALVISEAIRRGMGEYRTMFFSVPARSRGVVSENIRRMYLGKPHGTIAECLFKKPKEAPPGHELWSMSVRGSEVSRCYGCYWLNETARPRIVRSVT